MIMKKSDYHYFEVRLDFKSNGKDDGIISYKSTGDALRKCIREIREYATEVLYKETVKKNVDYSQKYAVLTVIGILNKLRFNGRNLKNC